MTIDVAGGPQQKGVALTDEQLGRIEAIRPVPGKERLFIITGLGGQSAGNVAALVTEEGVIIVDDKYPKNFAELVEKIRSITPLPVKYVLNTHHHGDHTGSNAAFLEFAETIMHRNARANMVKNNQPGAGHIVFSDQQSVFLGGFEVQMHYMGRGHTNGDAVVYFPALQTIHTGDLISEGQRPDGSALTPVLDYGNGASGREWAQTLENVLTLDFDTAIPGHGFIMSKDGVRAYRQKIVTLRERLSDLIKHNVPKDEIATRLKTDDLAWPVSSGNFLRGLGLMYDELAGAS